MKKTLLTMILLCVASFAQATTQPIDLGLTSMNGNYYYEYGVSWSLPSGNQLTSATLIFTGIQLTSFGLNNPGLLWTHLLNSTTMGLTTRTDSDNGSDAFAGQGLLLGGGSRPFPTLNQPQTFSYSLDLTTLGTYLADGKFGIGIDPDCRYTDSSIKLYIDYRPSGGGGGSVPDGGSTAMLLGATMVGLGWISRKMRS